MIGVACAPEDRDVIAELFQLFKTPWCFIEDVCDVQAVLVTEDSPVTELRARVVLGFAGRRTWLDDAVGLATGNPRSGAQLATGQDSIPIHGDALPLGSESTVVLARLADGGEPAAVEVTRPQRVVLRFGYDLVAELRTLLGPGQEPETAPVPTLDLHVELLRSQLARTLGVLAEIPPVRSGHSFGVCLTHDIDFLSIRDHRFDRTILGFVWRSAIGSVRDVVTGHGSIRRLWANWFALVRLPLVLAGVLPDVWDPFGSYERADGARSTFFVIPLRGVGGRGLPPERSRRRAVKYDVTDVATTVRRLAAVGYEIAVHGIDAWLDPEAGRSELRRVAEVLEDAGLGIRMHWLCHDERTPEKVEQAGFVYDATSGFNDAVGFKAGTTQVFRPTGADRLLELPLHVQDTALFFPGRLHLREDEAWELVSSIRRSARRFGGVVTVSWHDRSLAPERLWDQFYSRLLAAFRAENVWFGTGRAVVEWFQLRRRVAIDRLELEDGVVRLAMDAGGVDVESAGMVVRLHVADGPQIRTIDLGWDGSPSLMHELVPQPAGSEQR